MSLPLAFWYFSDITTYLRNVGPPVIAGIEIGGIIDRVMTR
jgi:hypothetical protein